MSLTFKNGATQTGGTDVTATNTGDSKTGEVSFALPTSTRLNPKIVKVFSNTPVTTKDNPGRARGGMRIILANRVDPVAGCCDVKQGTVIVDVSVSWPLDQPEALADDAISYLRGLVYTQAFVDAVKKGTLPL